MEKAKTYTVAVRVTTRGCIRLVEGAIADFAGNQAS
jgi:hypothetical protein